MSVFVIVVLGSRRTVHSGATRDPADEWPAQEFRQATACGIGPRLSIRDRERPWHSIRASRVGDRSTGNAVSRSQGERGLASHAVCERLLGSVRRECLDHVVILNERHLHRLVKEYKAYFNQARPHQGIEQRVPCCTPRLEAPPVTAMLSSRPVLNGLHRDYSWLMVNSAEQIQIQCSPRQSLTVRTTGSPRQARPRPGQASTHNVVNCNRQPP